MVGFWVFHLFQRRYKAAGVRKRIATLGFTILVIGAWVVAWLFSRYSIDDIYLLALPVAAIAILAGLRRTMLPYRLRCVRCGKPLGMVRMLSFDSNICEACAPPPEGEPPR